MCGFCLLRSLNVDWERTRVVEHMGYSWRRLMIPREFCLAVPARALGRSCFLLAQ